LNDQFTGGDVWEQYLTTLEQLAPTVRALGVTDYYSTKTYERVRAEKKAGRLPKCELIFPNIEMRLALGTVRGKWVNVHLLVSPDDPQHLEELNRFLKRITFKAHKDTYCCEQGDLIKLGKTSDTKIIDDGPALAHGTVQFKVAFDNLRDVYEDSKWAQENILIAVAGGETDGASGLRDGGDVTIREEVEKFAHIIFASAAPQRQFWLGEGKLSEEEMFARYGGLKPCLHGSDAHELGKVGMPTDDRSCWVKGAVAFDTLRQACIDPKGRAFIGIEPPIFASASQVIASVEIVNAGWAETKELPLNSGLVAIIGARGSGKTALADIIALGCDAIRVPASESSFLMRAQNLLEGASVRLQWEEGEAEERQLDRPGASHASPRARYLSQQFVEELCSAHEVTDTLLKEIERVIFNAHPTLDRDGAVNFEELLEARVARLRQNRQREEDALAELSERIGVDLEKKSQIGEVERLVAEKAKLITGYDADRKKLVTKGSEGRLTRLNELSAAAEKVKGQLRIWNNNVRSLLGLQDEVVAMRQHGAPQSLQASKERFQTTFLDEDEWAEFLLDYQGDVDVSLTEKLQKGRAAIAGWKGTAPAVNADPNISYISEGAVLDKLPLATLEAEINRLEKLVNVDKDTSQKFSNLSRRLVEEHSALAKLQERLKDCKEAPARALTSVNEREAAYRRVFDTVQSEQGILKELYQPLMDRLAHAGGTLKKLSFSVNREVDLDAWAEAGEELFDLRQKSPFRGKGNLQTLAAESLEAAWKSGTSAEVGAAMTKFRTDHSEALLETSIIAKTDPRYRNWLKQFAKWLYSTDHIQIRYSVDYDGVDIRKLSPGTRGIVLLLLYLALDEDDDRPLIIDQPEENLDPKSIYDELVGLFLKAKSKRQVIMVTHNANLVVNTDADQIIIAEAGPHRPGELPPITYTSGGLENAGIRKTVCDILEGGERAFQERARRLRVRLAR
jgi:hypothetical protein